MNIKVKPVAQISRLKDYVPGKSVEEVREKWGLEKIYKLASNENPLGPSPLAIQAAGQAAADAARYPRGEAPELRQKLAHRYNLEPENLVFSNGSDEMIWMLATAWAAPGRKVVSADQTFSEYLFCSDLVGADFVKVPLQDWCFDTEAILKAIDDNTSMVYICNPNNPTGTILNTEILKDFISRVPENVLVIVDEAYAEYALEQSEYTSAMEWVNQYSNLVVLRTFSKVWGLAGFRLGYAVANQDLISVLLKVKQPFNVGSVTQAAALAALEDDGHLQKTLELNRQGMQDLKEVVEQCSWSYLDSSANFLAVKVGEKCGDLVEYLEKNGVIVRWLKSFNMNEWMRITIGLPEENALLFRLMKDWSQNHE